MSLIQQVARRRAVRPDAAPSNIDDRTVAPDDLALRLMAEHAGPSGIEELRRTIAALHGRLEAAAAAARTPPAKTAFSPARRVPDPVDLLAQATDLVQRRRHYEERYAALRALVPPEAEPTTPRPGSTSSGVPRPLRPRNLLRRSRAASRPRSTDGSLVSATRSWPSYHRRSPRRGAGSAATSPGRRPRRTASSPRPGNRASPRRRRSPPQPGSRRTWCSRSWPS